MKIASISSITALAILAGIAAAPAVAQEAPAAVSDPLKNYTLDMLVPARSANVTDAAEAMARQWIDGAARMRTNWAEARSLVKTHLATKDIEIKALEARVKEAKATGDKIALENLKQQIKAQETQLDALQGIQQYAGLWDELAAAQDRAGKEWLEFLAAEAAVAQRQEGLSRELVKKADSPLAGQPTAEDFKLHRKLVDEYKEFGTALEDMGEVAKKLGESSGSVLSAWEKRNLAK
jgi:hypothetical protein